MDDIGRRYLTLALHLNRHFEGFVDAYFGPPELKAEADAGPSRSPDLLAEDASELQLAIGASEYDPQRKDYLVRQTGAMSAAIRKLSGEEMDFVQEVELYYDITPEMVDESVLGAVHAEIDRLLPGEELLAERLRAWEKSVEVPADRLLAVLERASEEARRRTVGLFDLPPGEEVAWELVEDKPWWAYNWYRGQYRSLIEVNTDMPIPVHQVLQTVTHEAYPGHHTEGAIKEQRLYRQEGRAEHAIQVLGPESALSEGIAVCALGVLFSDSAMESFLRDELCPMAGLPGDEAERLAAVSRASDALRAVTSNAALLLHRDGQSPQIVARYVESYAMGTLADVARTMEFIQMPLWRSYAFNYTMGRELVASLVEGPDGVANFARLLSEPFTPSQVRQWVTEEGKGTKP